MSTSRLAAGRSRLRTSRFLASLLAVSAVAAVVVTVATGGPEETVAQPITEAPDTGAALVAARAQGTEVEAVGMRTATRSVFALPDGRLRARLSLTPQRVRRGDEWVPVDTSLHVTDRGVTPGAADVGLAFSRGGADAPLVELARAGTGFALSWPGALPEPRVDGRNATYVDVLPGVDLVMTAVDDGYDQHIVVKNAEAAKNPALQRVRLGMKTTGLAVTADDKGGLDMRDAAGAEVFTVPPSTMWDSKRQAGEAPRTDLAPVGVEVTADSLTIVPDQRLLTDPSTVYPVYIDPGPRTVHKSGWTTVYYNGTAAMGNGTHWNGANSQAEDKWWVQVDPTARSGVAYESPYLLTRSYFMFDTGFLAGKAVSGARLDTAVVHGPACNWSHTHRLHKANWGIGPDTNWNNQPTDGGETGRAAVSTVNGNCTGQKGLSFGALGGINAGGSSTYFIRADDEGNDDYWRKFNPNDTTLVVEYNGTPNQPTEPHTVPDPVACRWCGGMPYVGDSTITLKARVSDPDGDQVHAEWDVYDIAEDGTYNKQVRTGGWVSSDSPVSTTVDLTGFHNRKINWYVRAKDGVANSPYAGFPEEFTVDRVAPKNQPEVVSAVYPEDNRWHGGASVPGVFRFTAKDADVNAFEYGWTDGAWTDGTSKRVDADKLGGVASLPLTPPGDGPRDLFVRSLDRAGNPGPKRVYHFYVRPGNGALAQWQMEGNTRDTAHLGDRHATAHGSVSFVAGAVGSALALDGAGYAEAPNAVRTDQSFSVSAWVRMDQVGDTWHTAVSQDGANICGFCLQYEGSSKRWVFVMPHNDSSSPSGYSFVRSTEEPAPDAWTHLVGVHDAEAKQLRLYVNGELAGTTPRSVNWNATGPLRIGQAVRAGVPSGAWNGALDEVRVHDRALTQDEVRGDIRRDGVHVAHWRFEGVPGSTTALNSVAGGVSALLSGGAEFFAQRVDGDTVLNRAVRFAGTGEVATDGPVVRTDKSFTVSASVVLADVTGTMTVLSQDGADGSGFVLRHDSGRWEFGITQAGSTSWNALAQSVAGSAVAGTPTHLTGVFDSATKKVALYVNGREAGVSAAATAPLWDATGPFAMGRGLRAGAPADPLRGELDEVRVHSRALAAAEIEPIATLDSTPLRQWKLDGDGGDTSGRGKSLTPDAPVDWVTGQSATSDPKDLAVRLRGTSMNTEHAVDTSRSFSVSAWARLDKVGAYAALASQDGRTTSAFQLQATQDGHWALAMFARDENGGGPTHDRAVGSVVQQGVWTHLVGTYDADSDQMSLYVNGDLVATAAHANAWDHSTGRFHLGRALWSGSAVDFFPGALDDVEVHGRVLFATEIRDKAGRDLSLVHKWQFDEGVGATAGDSVGSGTGTLVGGAAFAPGRLGNAIGLDGVDDAVSTTAVPRTDEDFTVSAWVHLPNNNCTTTKCKRVAVSQDGDRNSKFRLGFVKDREHPYGNWLFEMPEADTDTTVITAAAVSAESADFGSWVHLVGVYNKSAKRILLYVNSNRVGEGTVESSWRATGGVQIGRGRLAGGPAELWPGSVDDVRLNTGSLDDDAVSALYESYPEEDQPPAELPAADLAHWKLDESAGSTGADSSGSGNVLTFTGPVSWIGGRSGRGVQLDGTSGFGQTGGPVVDTSRSFSVSTWAYLNKTGANFTIAGQDGNRVSSFLLQYNAAGKWAVVMPTADQDNPSTVVLLSAEDAVVGRWTHVAAVYDADAKQLRLYVNGLLSAVQVGVVAWNGTGPFTVGRDKWNGVNGHFFPRVVDEVRVFGRALSHGEIAEVHDDMATNDFGLWQFNEGNGNDTSWRKNTLTFSGQPSYPAGGIAGTAVKLDGASSATALAYGVNTRDSFTISAWARLDRGDRAYTVVSQDGTQVSGFLLQYRPESGRWAFSAPAQDATSAPLIRALSAEPAEVGRWTHLAGVYDHVAGRMRLYVGGQLTGEVENRLWVAEGPLAIGRAKSGTGATEQFGGLIDEVRAEQGMVAPDRILLRATRPAPPGGQLGRYVSEKGEHYTGHTDVAPLPGFRFEGTFGAPVPADHANTRTLYSCQSGSDMFTSAQADCEGGTKIGEIGAVYTAQPTNVPVIPLYRCVVNADRFDSTSAGCEGRTQQQLLGYTLGYAPLARYIAVQSPWDHWSTAQGVQPGYRLEGVLGWVTTSTETGTAPLYVCRSGADVFSSLDAACEGATKVADVGRIWTSPPAGAEFRELSRCVQVGTTNRYDSTTNCTGHEYQQRLGYLLVTAPATTPSFPTA
ncbi:LamG domain-containing protein [Actinosynnema sp. NPDC091369]